MMNKYYNILDKVEVVGVELDSSGYPILSEGVIPLPESNPFFSPLASGKRLTYDPDGVPNGVEDIPVQNPTELERAVAELMSTGVNNNTITAAIYLKETKGDDTLLLLIESMVDAAVVEYGEPHADIVSALFNNPADIVSDP